MLRFHDPKIFIIIDSPSRDFSTSRTRKREKSVQKATDRAGEKRKIDRKRDRYPATFVPFRIIAEPSEETRGEEHKKWPQPGTDREPLLSPSAEKNEESNRYKLGIRWLGAFSSRVEGGGVLGHGKIHESRDYRLVLRPKCLQGNNGVSEIIRVTGGERWKLFSPQFPFVGARSHLGSLGFFEKRREREREVDSSILFIAQSFSSPLFLSRSDGGGGRSYFLLWSVFHFSETERDLSNKRGMLDLRDDP